MLSLLELTVMDRRLKVLIILVPVVCVVIGGAWLFVSINTPQGPVDVARFVRYVRGNPDYGVNDFLDNGDGTVTDNATGLMWSQADSSEGLNWQEALAWVQQRNTESYIGYSDWRLPNAKELQSIVDYTRSPSTTSSAAINPLFSVTPITDEGGGTNYPYYWTSTTHLDGPDASFAVYLSFGEALGYMPSQGGVYGWVDIHGAGAQRSDPKSGDPADYPSGHGPQCDAVRIYNYVRLVRTEQAANSYVVVDTGQDTCYDNTGAITAPALGNAFYGQDAQHDGAQPSYQNNGDGTITDQNTGLMWQKTPGDKVTHNEAVVAADTFTLAGYDDWRLPTIKELYSLINFNGMTGMSEIDSTPYIDTSYFDFEYGDVSAGERMIDAQFWSSTEYVGGHLVFGVNFADGRIKGY